MNRIIAIIITLIFISCGCASLSETVGNGVLDDNEKPFVQLAIATAFVSAPDSVQIAYDVATDILDKELASVLVAGKDEIMKSRATELGYTETEAMLLVDMVNGLIATIQSAVDLSDACESDRVDLAVDILTMVRDSALARGANDN